MERYNIKVRVPQILKEARKNATLNDFREWYDSTRLVPVHESGKTPLNPNYPISNNCFLGIIGKPGSGKSWTVKHIMEQNPCDVVFFVSTTGSFDSTRAEHPIPCKYQVDYNSPNVGVHKVYNYLRRRDLIREVNQMIYDVENCPLPWYTRKEYIELCTTKDDLLMGIEEDFFDPTYRVMVILDDCGMKTTEMKGRATPLEELAVVCRHLGVNSMVLIQAYTQLAKPIRRLFSEIILTKKVTEEDMKDLKGIIETVNYPSITGPGRFAAFVSQCCKGNEFDSVHFLYGGIYHGNKLMDNNEIERIIIEFESDKRVLSKKIRDRTLEKLNSS